MSELIVALKSDFDGDAKGLDTHHRHGSDEGANAHIYHRVCATASRRNAEYRVYCIYYDEKKVYEEDFFERVSQRANFFHACYLEE